MARRTKPQPPRILALAAASLTARGADVGLNYRMVLGPQTVSAVLSWNAPTTNTDDSALTGDDAIDRYRVEWGTVIDNGFGYFINSATTSATSLTLTDLPPGDYAFRVTAIAVDGEESDPYFIGTKTIT
jgi:predicted phage tail protein